MTGTGFTLDAHTTLTSADITEGAIASTALADGTLLLAATTGVGNTAVHLWHLSATLQVLGETSTPGGDPALYTTPTGAVLVTGATTYAVTTDPLALGAPVTLPTPDPGPQFGDWSPAPLRLPDGTTLLLRRNWRHVLDDTGHQITAGATSWGQAVTAHPGGVVDEAGTVHTLAGAPTGRSAAWVGEFMHTTTDPGADTWHVVSEIWGTGHEIRDQAGTLIATYGVPDDSRADQSATAHDGRGGSLALTIVQAAAADNYAHYAYIDHITTAGHTHTRHQVTTNTGIWNKATGGLTMTQHQGRWVAALLINPGGGYRLQVWTGTVPYARHTKLKVGVHQDGAEVWRKIGDESWADGPGRMKVGVPTSVSPSGWVMEVKPGDDTTAARWMPIGTHEGYEQAARFIPAPDK